MKWTRYEELCSEIYDFVFQLLDNEPDFDGYEAGEIATEIEKCFRNEVSSFQDMEISQFTFGRPVDITS